MYAPTRPAVDLTAGLLLLMAVGTVVFASLWSDLTDPDQANESYSILAKVCILFLFVNKKVYIFPRPSLVITITSYTSTLLLISFY